MSDDIKYIKDKRDEFILIKLDSDKIYKEKSKIEVSSNLLICFGVSQLFVGLFIIILLFLLIFG